MNYAKSMEDGLLLTITTRIKELCYIIQEEQECQNRPPPSREDDAALLYFSNRPR